VSGSWAKGTVWDRLALRWQRDGADNAPALDIFSELKEAQKLLVVPNDRIGGLFLGGVAYKLIRQAYPQAHIQLLVDSKKAAVAKQISFVDEVASADLDKPIWSGAFKAVRDQLRREEFDLAFCLGADCSFRLAQLCRVCGAKMRIGFSRAGLEPFNLEIVLGESSRYEIKRYHSMLDMLGLGGEADLTWSLASDKAEQIRTRYLGEDGIQIVGIDLARGEGRGLNRRQLEDIIGRLVEHGFRALLFFSLAERKQVNYLMEAYGNRTILFEQEDSLACAALLEGCKALISCNTDLLHLAVLLRIPVVGIFESDPQRWIAADNSLVKVLQQSDLRSLSITDIVAALDEQLQHKKLEKHSSKTR
jgi:ADP-heptose:LPS heptosyltransferase